MERDGAHSPDAASIRPVAVSSLRAKFEGLQRQNLPKPDLGPYKASPTSLRPTEPSKQSPTIRASLDLPRPQSPWSLNHQNERATPNGPSRTAESPTRSDQKRPTSMLLHSSPQLPPSVQVEPPRSPPRILFPRRGASKSPDRLETASQNELSRITPQPSSREPSRSPARPFSRAGPTTDTTISTSAARSKSPVPPPVNRAEKPKIPAKPAITPAPAPAVHDAVLSPNARYPSAESRASPFSTPPSSDDGGSPPNVLGQPVPPEDPPTLSKLSSSVEERGRPNLSQPSHGRDPRFMGFSAPRSTSERKDPRTLGFAKPEPARPPSRDANRPKTTVKIPSQNSSAMPLRDPRQFGFDRESPSAKPQHEPQRALPSTPKSELLQTGPIPVRDARNFGFNASRQSPPREEPRPDLPQRHQPKIPPPRPSEDTKRPVYQPGIMSRPQRSLPPPVTESRPKQSGDIPRQVIINTSDVRFPPPPKRAAGDDDDSRRLTPVSTAANPMFSRRGSADHNARAAEDSDEAEESRAEPITARHEYPDATQTNRRPPMHSSGLWEINSKTDGKVFDVCGKFLCAASYHTRVFDLVTGDSLLAINHGETIKTTAVCFKPGASIDAEGKRIWIGNNVGDLQEIDIETQSIVSQSSAHNRREIHRIFRHQKDIWTLDDEGKLFVWGADEGGTPNLRYSHVSYKLSRPPTFSLIVHDKIWVASGKEIRIYQPGNDAGFNVLKSPLIVQAAGDVTCGTFSDNQSLVYLGHADGKVTVYSTKDYTCRANIKVSDYKINGLTFVDNKLWAVYKTGKVYVYDTSSTPWKVLKDWRAHDGPATGVMLDPSSIWTLNKLQVITAGHDQYIRLWDGLLEDDWIETAMHDRNAEYCSFREVRAAITTWNCGASHPGMLKTNFIADAVHCDDPDPPEILVFGFQEVVDLEDRTVTAKSLLGFGKSKNKTADSSENQSRVYREWRDYLSRCVEKYIPHHVYTELHTSSLIGLFQCIFVRQSERRHISNLSAAPIKTGMGGHYGNKGALLARFILDDSSLVFINCHLAAGQTHTSHRNNDVATILESEALPSESDLPTRSTLYTGGGDGSQILDHEIAILNGDLNYRIDTIPRDTVIKHINNNNLAPLLERDQINVSRRRVSGFRLAPFVELPIRFAPTYKYDVGTDRYDTSEKKRAPAWCDRILFRSSGGANTGNKTVQQLEYRRHEGVRESDHRPVSGVFSLQIKKVDVARQRAVMEDSYIRFEGVKRRVAESECLRYLVSYLGVRPEEAKKKLLAL